MALEPSIHVSGAEQVLCLKEFVPLQSGANVISVKRGDILVLTRNGKGIIVFDHDNSVYTDLESTVTVTNVTNSSITINRTNAYSGDMTHYTLKEINTV